MAAMPRNREPHIRPKPQTLSWLFRMSGLMAEGRPTMARNRTTIREPFLRDTPQSIRMLTPHMAISVAEVKAAKLRHRKKAQPTKRPPAMPSNISVRAMKVRPLLPEAQISLAASGERALAKMMGSTQTVPSMATVMSPKA